jgi:putative SOS response-associated peptidase YedK
LTKGASIVCHHYRNAKNLPADFVEEYHFRPDQRKYFDDIVHSLKDGGAWPLKTVPALRIDDAGELEAFGAEWGLLPRWWKPSDKQPKRAAFQRGTFNARSETAASKPTFRDAFKRRRCLVPFVEFHEREHYFGVRRGNEFEPMAFAGLWESWQGADADVLSVTFLTTEPNAKVASVGHDRMPLLLDTPEVRRRWLVDGADDEMLRPFRDGVLSIRPKG